MKKIRIVFVGTGEFGCQILNNFIQDDRLVVPLVITGQDKRAGRGLESQISPVKSSAILNKLIIQQPLNIKDAEQKIAHAKPDFLLVVSYGEIIPKEILSIPRIAAVNVHASLLPKYRGASPIQEALRRGDHETGITWIQMDQHMDTGDIIEQSKLRISNDDDAEALSGKLSQLAAEKTADVLLDYSQTKTKQAQVESEASYCHKIKKEDGIIDAKSESAEEIMNRIRAFSVWPGCSLNLSGKRIKIIRATIGEQKISPGEMACIEGKTLIIGTKNGSLLPLVVQPESKRPMKIEEFLRGLKNLPKNVG